MFRIIPTIEKKDGWYPVSQKKGSHVKMKHGQKKSGIIIFPNHGSQEVGKRT